MAKWSPSKQSAGASFFSFLTVTDSGLGRQVHLVRSLARLGIAHSSGPLYGHSRGVGGSCRYLDPRVTECAEAGHVVECFVGLTALRRKFCFFAKAAYAGTSRFRGSAPASALLQQGFA